MADPEEDKSQLAARLEEDYNIPRRLNASIREYPWAWVVGAARNPSERDPDVPNSHIPDHTCVFATIREDPDRKVPPK